MTAAWMQHAIGERNNRKSGTGCHYLFVSPCSGCVLDELAEFVPLRTVACSPRSDERSHTCDLPCRAFSHRGFNTDITTDTREQQLIDSFNREKIRNNEGNNERKSL